MKQINKMKHTKRWIAVLLCFMLVMTGPIGAFANVTTGSGIGYDNGGNSTTGSGLQMGGSNNHKHNSSTSGSSLGLTMQKEKSSSTTVGSLIWIKSGSNVYTNTSGTEKHQLIFSYQVKITEIINGENGKPEWYRFDFTGSGWGEAILRNYHYVKAEDTSMTEPEDANTEPKLEQTVGESTFTSSTPVVVNATGEAKQKAILENVSIDEDWQTTYLFDIQGEDSTTGTTITVSDLIDINQIPKDADPNNYYAVVLHLLDSADAIQKALTTGGIAYGHFDVSATDAEQFQKEIAAAKAYDGSENRVYYVVLNTEINDENDTITFQTDSFSTFMYIVTFAYNGYSFDMTGGSSVYLSDLMKNLGLDEKLNKTVADVTDVTFTDSTLLQIEKNQNDWVLSPLQSFSSTEYLTLTFAGGTTEKIKVTDPTVMYCVSHTERLNTSRTTTHTINRSDASNNPYKSGGVVNNTTISKDDVTKAADDKDDTEDLVIYAAPGMAIRFASGIGFPDGSWSIDKSNNDSYKHGNWEWVWSGNTNYILLNESITESTYVDFTVTADSKKCNVRIWIIPNPSNNQVTKVHDTVKDSTEYEVKTIPVTLYDYDGLQWNNYWSEKNNGVWYAFSGWVQGVSTRWTSASKDLATKTDLTLSWTGGNLPNSGNLSQGVFKNKLGNDNLPVFASTTQTDVFGKISDNGMGKTVYNDVGMEFIYEKDNGFYTYSSNLNHAQYNSENNTIELYDQTLGSMIGNTAANSVAGFYPFQDISQAIPNWGYNGFGWKEKLSDPYNSNTRYNGQYAWDLVASTDVNATINLHFALQIEADFYMPTNSRSQFDSNNDGTNDDLIYEFTGDDDLWVFVDDQLVLDLGGAHTPKVGWINFTTKEVYVENYYPVTASGDTYTEDTSASDRGNAKTFTFKELGIDVAADQMHTLRVFYMERWSGESNCRMRFNLPIAPENSVMVSKELTNQDGDSFSVTPDVDYTFQVFTALSDSKKDDVLNEEDFAFKALSDAEYYILGDENKKLKTANDGTFTLKSGQTAVFTGIPRFTEVYAVEVTPNDGYVYTGVTVSVNSETAKDYTWGNATEKKIIPLAGVTSFKFTNKMQTQPLTITKEVVNGTNGLINKEQEFTFNLEFTKAILEKGKVIQANDYKSVTDGSTFTLRYDESITIPRVPVNMTFDFGEQNPDSTNNSFDKPTYAFTTCTVTDKATNPNAMSTPFQATDFGNYSWTVQNGGENKITVTNQQRFDLKIVKNGWNPTDENQIFIFNIVGTDNVTNGIKMTVTVQGNKGFATIKGLPVGKYTVTENSDWSWRYEINASNNPSQGVDSTNVSTTTATATVTFTNKREEDKWLSGDCFAKNWWNGNKVIRKEDIVEIVPDTDDSVDTN